ncbi:MAG TPA: carboxypeptidase regulatory-like domain-containing protein [Armatimonadetes bacterium]|nr:carboxypeptidase regulatory-like domain-containing protein [Armatimonadota bacterium]
MFNSVMFNSSPAPYPMRLTVIGQCVRCLLMLCQVALFGSIGIAGVISGIVFEPDGETPAPKVEVWLSSANIRLREQLHLPRKTITDETGRYTFNEIPEGDYTVRALRGSQHRATQNTRVSMPTARVGCMLTLRRLPTANGAVIVGRVVTKGGVGERLLPDAVVLVRSTNDANFTPRQITADEFGMFLITGIPIGRYMITAVPPMANVSRNRLQQLLIAIPGRTIDVTERNCIVTVTVLASEEASSFATTQRIPFQLLLKQLKLRILGQQHKPIKGATVQFIRSYLFVPREQWFDRRVITDWLAARRRERGPRVTDNDGNITLELPIPDNSMLLMEILVSGYMPKFVKVNAPAGQKQFEVTVKCAMPTGRVKVLVKDANAGKPLPEVYVRLLPADDDTREAYKEWQRKVRGQANMLRAELTKARGKYRIYSLPIDNPRSRNYARVYLLVGRTDKNGVAELTNIPPGAYQVYAWRAGGRRRRRSAHFKIIHVEPAEMVEVTIKM